MGLFDRFRLLWDKALDYSRLAKIGEIARRYFAMNAFDGALTIIGVLMGNMTARVSDPRIVVNTGLATSIAMGISGLWGAYLTEAAERRRNLVELGRYTLSDLSETKIGEASRFAVIVVAVVDGIAPALAAAIILIPFLLIGLLSSIQVAYFASLGVALITLFGLGVFLGHISRQNLVLYGLRTLVAGVVSILISLLLGAGEAG